MTNSNKAFFAIKKAFPFTLPVLTGYGFLGLAYGILMNVSGFSFWYPFIISIVVFGGSLQYLAVSILLSAFSPVAAFMMALFVQARHLFYGIAMLDKYKNLGWKKYLLIFLLTDETFSINCGTDIPEGVDEGWFYLSVSLLDYSYWVLSSLLGGIAGSLISFNTEGLDFAMTAMFVVIFMNQWKKEKKHYTGLIGMACSLVCLYFFGPGNFLIPTMIAILVLLTVFKKKIEEAGL